MSARILVVGDAMIDRYWHGDTNRISPDAPVPVVGVHRIEDRQGAAANVAANIEAMGGEVHRCFSPSFNFHPVVKLRVVSRRQHVVRLDFDEPQQPVDISAYQALLRHCGVVVISDYGKGALRDINEIVTMAVQAGAKVLVDPKGFRYEKYRGASMVKPNLEEMRALVGGWDSEDELEYKTNAMRVKAGIDAVLLTRGAEGMTLFNGKRWHIAARKVELLDPSGAGEAAISAFAVAVAKGADFAEAAHWANKAASIAVTRFGTSVVTEEEVFSGAC